MTLQMWQMKGLILVSLVSGACQGTRDAAPRPAPLIEGLNSFENLERVRAQLEARGIRTMVTRQTTGDKARPRYDWTTLEAPALRYQDCPGRVELYFFNDRLMQAIFYPSGECNLGRLEAIAREHATEDVRVFSRRDAAERGYVSWVDKSLERENAAWIDRWS
jgi:hypothetical protein